jgi:hypothetical protein
LGSGEGSDSQESSEMKAREWWERITSSRYTGQLEAEVARLRVENRALLNSILGIAGVPPVMVAGDKLAGEAGDGKVGVAPATNGNAARGTVKRNLTGSGAGNGTKSGAGPVMRRRSWQQIYRMLEMDSVRKKEAGEII